MSWYDWINVQEFFTHLPNLINNIIGFAIIILVPLAIIGFSLYWVYKNKNILKSTFNQIYRGEDTPEQKAAALEKAQYRNHFLWQDYELLKNSYSFNGTFEDYKNQEEAKYAKEYQDYKKLNPDAPPFIDWWKEEVRQLHVIALQVQYENKLKETRYQGINSNNASSSIQSSKQSVAECEYYKEAAKTEKMKQAQLRKEATQDNRKIQPVYVPGQGSLFVDQYGVYYKDVMGCYPVAPPVKVIK